MCTWVEIMHHHSYLLFVRPFLMTLSVPVATKCPYFAWSWWDRLQRSLLIQHKLKHDIGRTVRVLSSSPAPFCVVLWLYTLLLWLSWCLSCWNKTKEGLEQWIKWTLFNNNKNKDKVAVWVRYDNKNRKGHTGREGSARSSNITADTQTANTHSLTI